MPHPQIKFGTDGWRGVIADDFTFANVRIAAEAIAAYVHAQEDPAKGLCIGYDTRFGSKAFARACAEVVAATGIPVLLANDITPTPALSFGVRERGAAGGIMITSSHNPAQWNGVKYKAWYGGSGKPSIMRPSSRISASPSRVRHSPRRLREVDFLPAYLKAIESFADLDLIAKSGMKFASTPCTARARTILSDIFTRIGVDHVQIRGNVDPLFPGINPEPIEPHIRALGEAAVAQRLPRRPLHRRRRRPHRRDRRAWQLRRSAQNLFRAAELGAAAQGLARRRHARLQHHQNARPHLRETRPRADRARHRLQVCLRLHAGARNRDGRRGVGRHRLPAPSARARRPAQRLLLANVMAEEGKTLGQLVADLQAEYGEHQYGRIDLHIPDDIKNAAIARANALKPGDPVIAGMPILRQETLDGVKFYLDNPEAKTKPNAAETWLLFRASGTEPLMRIYTESCSKESVAKLLESGRKFALSNKVTGLPLSGGAMFIHIFGFRWKPQATEADKARAAQEILAFRGHILGLIECTSARISRRAARDTPLPAS